MGNRAVITTSENGEVQPDNIGIYLHWNGGYDSVSAFLTYCDLKDYRVPESDCYGMARLCQVIGNYFGGGLSVGIDTCKNLDCDNYDNGVYFIKDWKIVGRQFKRYPEQNQYDLYDMLREINQAMPEREQIKDLDEAILKLQADKSKL
jgi:hypothetical protein